eukprot:gnl/MRDRNA2_/MRDRNA2_72908_c0_seq1.p1 gnl/MRDRNA2_/MRDRNA2_72908_c0~~gnl/MRDRNA2_/MRDRNA2_72908_c0_seq1.p1  ORF type:complete len:203 (+),score=40.27 gnl/MRDRNA2_/MRDRNA2_72908_c0_seq1:61-609(+)
MASGMGNRMGNAIGAPVVPQGGVPEIGQFCKMWGLDSNCEKMLWQAPAGIAQTTMKTFAPKANTQNVSGLFVSFLKRQFENEGMPFPGASSGVNGSKSGPGKTSAIVAVDENMDYIISEFIQQWGLDAGCEQILRQTDPDTAAAAMEQFSPKAATQNISGLFISFMKTFKPGFQQGNKFSPY